MSQLGEALQRIDRVMSARPSTSVNQAEFPVVRGGFALKPRLVFVAALTGIVGLAFGLASHRGWTRFSPDQISAGADRPAGQAALMVSSPEEGVPPAPEREHLHRQGVRAARSGDYEGAEMAFLRLLELDPTSAEVHNNLGVASIQRGALQQGIVAFRSALRLAPDYAEATLNLAIALERRGEVAEAVTHYRRFLSLAGAERRLERERVVNHLASGITKRKPLHDPAAYQAR